MGLKKLEGTGPDVFWYIMQHSHSEAALVRSRVLQRPSDTLQMLLEDNLPVHAMNGKILLVRSDVVDEAEIDCFDLPSITLPRFQDALLDCLGRKAHAATPNSPVSLSAKRPLTASLAPATDDQDADLLTFVELEPASVGAL
jgi:hypothetical protein